MSTVQEKVQFFPQAEKTLSERLKKAYKRISPNLRPEAIDAFCRHHRIKPQTFAKKRCGAREATEGECQWMEEYSEQLESVQ